MTKLKNSLTLSTQDSSNDVRAMQKVKQFLSTLIQFGSEISQETGDKVQDLVINLVVSWQRWWRRGRVQCYGL